MILSANAIPFILVVGRRIHDMPFWVHYVLLAQMISYVSYFSFKFTTFKFYLLVIYSIFQIGSSTRRFVGLLSLFYQHFYFHFIAVSC